ncbi:glycosyltransferase [Paenibacillus radicis (ex Xue et al. 2023)]|uniref:Tetratricopeptide repeat protein n=1 Tax=Paenibacillus radicis (ex Xue et al. 2023) TaxID=2972489 RepID=A0ABT1YPD0_9BACL|nr:glycosyltransferase [Paenibacillus radicis (ex Xue et al. 2023)]MCR8635029.1 tetratricopeptide repeat protein [Paenibacillus radicis (ex Xue et al. 2023)]
MDKPLISLCMIVKNEEDCIAQCLLSARTAADELIVMDTGSTDQTVEIAKRTGAAVHIREWKNDFAAARNESINLASGEWILVLDADEILEEGHGALLREVIANSPDADGFFVRIVNFIGTEAQHAGSSVSASLRLFRNKQAYRYEGRIHEQIVQPILSANPAAKLLYSNIQLNHGGYLPEVVQKKNKVQRNMDLLLQELENTDSESFHRYNLGVEYMRAGDYTLAQEQFCLSRTVTDWRKTSFGHVVVLREVNCLQALGRWEEAADLCRVAASDLNNYPDLFFTLGRIHYHLRQWEQAEEAFHKALEIGESPPQYTSVSGVGTYSASFHLGKTREQLGDYDGAVQWYANALTFNSGLLSPFLRLISLLARLHNANGITNTMERLFHLESPKTWWSIALSYYQLGLYEQATDILKNKPMPVEKREERQLLLLRCYLLLPGNRAPGYTGVAARHKRTVRKLFYMALVRNDDKAAARWLQRLEQERAQRLKQKQGITDKHTNESFDSSDSASELVLNLHAYLLKEREQHVIPLHLPASAYSALWSELYFLYILASNEHLFALQTQIQTYWLQLLTLLPDPLQRLKGRYELIKCVHVRIYQLLQNKDGDLEYAALWNDVKPRLMTLIDDLLMEEVN